MRSIPTPFLIALACGFAFSACESLPRPEPAYHRVVETNVRGEWTVSWIAEGSVWGSEGGCRFRAVQRNIYNKPDMEIHYPLGRKVTVWSSNILVEPAEKPQWLEQLDAGAGDTRKNQKNRKVERLRSAAPAGS